MPTYSNISKERLLEAHEDLQIVFEKVLELGYDHTIVCTYRNEEDQNREYAEGDSELKYPQSKHNKLPSLAVDAVPYPSLYDDEDKMTEFGGFVLGVAAMLKAQGIIKSDIQWGFQLWGWDKPHFQIKT